MLDDLRAHYSDQLLTPSGRLCLQEDIREANAEDGEFSSRTVKSFRTLFHPIAGLPLTKNDNSEDDDQKLGSSPTFSTSTSTPTLRRSPSRGIGQEFHKQWSHQRLRSHDTTACHPPLPRGRRPPISYKLPWTAPRLPPEQLWHQHALSAHHRLASEPP